MHIVRSHLNGTTANLKFIAYSPYVNRLDMPDMCPEDLANDLITYGTQS